MLVDRHVTSVAYATCCEWRWSTDWGILLHGRYYVSMSYVIGVPLIWDTPPFQECGVLCQLHLYSSESCYALLVVAMWLSVPLSVCLTYSSLHWGFCSVSNDGAMLRPCLFPFHAVFSFAGWLLVAFNWLILWTIGFCFCELTVRLSFNSWCKVGVSPGFPILHCYCCYDGAAVWLFLYGCNGFSFIICLINCVYGACAVATLFP